MENHAEKHSTLWWATAAMPEYRSLSENLQTDVCVVGAGIAGLTTAYLLAKEGKSVVVLDDGPVAGGMTGRTTGHLANALDDRFSRLENIHGEKGARLAAQSHAQAIDLIEKITLEESIECDFERVDAYLFAPPGGDTEELESEYEAAQRAGLEVEKIEKIPILNVHEGPCLHFRRQAQFHPLKYMAGLAQAFTKKGGKIFTRTHATTIEGGENAYVETESGKIVHAKAIVVATNVPVNNLFAIHTKQAPYTTYVIVARIPRSAAAKALYYDLQEERKMPEDVSNDSYHYVRFHSGDSEQSHDWLIVGGRDHKTGQQHDAKKRYAHLEAWANERWGKMGEVVYRWSGQVMEPVDDLAFIGPNPMDDDNVYIVTGDSGNGLTHGTIGGILLTDLIMGREHPWLDLYNPSRISLKATPDFLKENLNVAGQYLKDYSSGSEVDDSTNILPGEGALIRRGLKKIAVYKDEKGIRHECSAVCPHLGCIVHWNSDEKTWDCPCHGSRFDRHGHVITGPANKDLKKEEGVVLGQYNDGVERK